MADWFDNALQKALEGYQAYTGLRGQQELTKTIERTQNTGQVPEDAKRTASATAQGSNAENVVVAGVPFNKTVLYVTGGILGIILIVKVLK